VFLYRPLAQGLQVQWQLPLDDDALGGWPLHPSLYPYEPQYPHWNAGAKFVSREITDEGDGTLREDVLYWVDQKQQPREYNTKPGCGDQIFADAVIQRIHCVHPLWVADRCLQVRLD
jgi:hypothetical protein